MELMTEAALLELLQKQNISFVVRTHQPVYTVAEGEALHLPDVQAAAKSLFLTDDKRTSFYLIVLPLDKQLDLKLLRSCIGSRRLTMAKPSELNELLAMEPGSVTPFGLLKDEEHRVRCYFDADLAQRQIAVPLLCNTRTIWLECEELVKLLREYGHEISFLDM